MIRVKEEMQQETQQLLFEEQKKFKSQLAAEKATLEQQLFEERQAAPRGRNLYMEDGLRKGEGGCLCHEVAI